jgi:hypothetical protein
LNFQHPATNRATAISLCVAPRQAHAAWMAERCRIVADIARSGLAANLIGRDVKYAPKFEPTSDSHHRADFAAKIGIALAAVTTEAPQWHHRQRGRIPDGPTGPYLGTRRQ